MEISIPILPRQPGTIGAGPVIRRLPRVKEKPLGILKNQDSTAPRIASHFKNPNHNHQNYWDYTKQVNFITIIGKLAELKLS
jgi:hypothetical protein